MKRLLLLALCCVVPAQAADLGQARALLQQKKAADAWNLLAASESTDSGDPEYDYLLGVAALDSGHPAEAVTALERLLAVDPGNNGARMELARAYYALGADGLAEREFAQLQTLNPPPQARGAIEQYLRAIESRRAGRGAQHRGWLEAGLGYDDNITAVTDDFTAGVEQTYGLAGMKPSSGNATRRRDSTWNVGGGWNWRSAVSTWMYDADVSVGLKGYPGNTAYNSSSLSAGAGTAWRRGAHFLRAGVQLGGSWQDTEQTGSSGQSISNNRTTAGLSGQWRYDLDQTRQLSLQLQYTAIRYADVPVNDINQTLASVGLAQAVGGRALVLGSLWFGMDQAVNSLPSGQDYSRNNLGLRVTAQWQALDSVALFGVAGVTRRNDSDEFARASASGKGRDNSLDLTLGTVWTVSGPWSVRGQYTFSRNDSNFNLYDYQRNEFSLVLRRDFR